jgi:hypothetical protein
MTFASQAVVTQQIRDFIRFSWHFSKAQTRQGLCVCTMQVRGNALVTVGFWKPHSSWTGARLNAELQRFPSYLWRDSDPDFFRI